MSTLTLYDISSSLPGKAWTPNPWKARFVLNYKGLSYKTIWLEYNEIEGVAKGLGGVTPYKKSDGSPLYTLPMLHDSLTGATIIDSLRIAEYLDKTYPDTPAVVPKCLAGLTRAFLDATVPKVTDVLGCLGRPMSARALNPGPGKTYFDTTRAANYGAATLEDVYPKGEKLAEQWKKVEDVFEKIATYYDASESPSIFLTGDAPIFADFQIAAFLIWCRRIWGGPESEEWKNIATWGNGRWAKFLEALKKYETIV